MSIFSETLRVLWLICLWCAFIFVALASIAMAVIGVWPWGAMFFLVGFIGLSAIDTVLKGGIGYESNGGLFHHFFIFVHSKGTDRYRTLRVVCIGVAGLAGCTALGYLGYSLVRKEWLPALFFATSVAMNGWSVKKYVTVGITIPEKEDADSSSHASVQEAE